MSGEFLLNLVPFIADCASKVLLCIGQFVRVEAKLRFGNVEIVSKDDGIGMGRCGRGGWLGNVSEALCQGRSESFPLRRSKR